MNIERYIWPVIIAASFHGVLLFSIGKQPPPPPREAEQPRPIPPDITRIEMTNPETEPSEPGAGKAEPLPTQIDVPRAAQPEDIFKIVVQPSPPSIRPVMKLPGEISGLPGPGDHPIGNGGPGLPTIYNLDRIPRATVQPPPAYPSTMRSSDTSGSVTVEFVVDTMGRVITADAVRWTHREFVDPAVRAVLRWRFEPGTMGGRKVSFRMAVPIEFNAAR